MGCGAAIASEHYLYITTVLLRGFVIDRTLAFP